MKKVEVYQTDDGMMWDDENKAIRHDKRLKAERIASAFLDAAGMDSGRGRNRMRQILVAFVMFNDPDIDPKSVSIPKIVRSPANPSPKAKGK